MTTAPPPAIVLVGVGEMGGVFGRAFLKHGLPVYPALRDTDLDSLATDVPAPDLVLVTVGESDLEPALAAIPDTWKGRVGLLQNELLPPDWQRHDISDPTVAVVWFEKKPGRDVKVIIPTPVAGPSAAMVVASLASLDIPAIVIPDRELLFELVRKNLYILTVNIAGLLTGGTVGELWEQHEGLCLEVAEDVLAVQFRLAGSELDTDRLIAGMVEAIESDPDHVATGRSAPVRLERAIGHARAAGISVPALDRIRQEAT